MNNLSKALLSILVTLLSICKSGYSQNSNQDSHHIKELNSLPVQHYDLQISEILYVQPVGDYYIIIHRNLHGVSVMDKNGELKTHLGNIGRGPFEWQRPAFIQYLDGEITIWDAGNLKFMIFDEDFEPVREEYGRQYSIRGFDKNVSDWVAVYDQPANQKEFVYIYEKNTNGRFYLKESLGTISEEGRIKLFSEMIGGVLWNGEDLLWVDPAISGFFVFDLEENEIREFILNDDLFSVERWNEPQEMSQRTFNKIEEYFHSNSRIVSIQKLSDHILLEVEHFPNGQPVIRYHIFDLTYNYVTQLEAGEGGWKNYIRGVNGNKLFYWGENYLETGLNRSIRVCEIAIN